MGRLSYILILLAACVRGEDLANASRGATLLRTQQCLHCHEFQSYAPAGPLAKLLKKRLSASRLVGAMWSHAPTMWSAIGEARIATPSFTVREGHDTLAWFAAAGYFDPPGDAKRGANTFRAERCSDCHAESGSSEGPSIAQWQSLSDTVALLHAIWRHAPIMKAAMDKKRMAWPSLSLDEMSDILSYARRLMPNSSATPVLTLGEPQQGKSIFQQRGCMNCHQGNVMPHAASQEHTFHELAAILWDHAPMMTSLPPSLSRQEMASLVAYLWTSRYFEETGNAIRGKAVFTAKRCNACHSGFSTAQSFDAASMLAALWKHSPAILSEARQKGIPWPKFLDTEMADLIAYANVARRSTLVK